jgi:carbon monoxide dehydrogenase subunit G
MTMDTPIDFADSGSRIEVTYKADVQIGGTLASVGQLVIGGTAQRTIGEVFACVKRQLEG